MGINSANICVLILCSVIYKKQRNFYVPNLHSIQCSYLEVHGKNMDDLKIYIAKCKTQCSIMQLVSSLLYECCIVISVRFVLRILSSQAVCIFLDVGHLHFSK